MMMLRKCIAGLIRAAALICGGLYLVGLYMLTIWLVVGTLSAILVRDEHREAFEAGFSLSDVKRADERIESAKNRIFSALREKDAITIKMEERRLALVPLDAILRGWEETTEPDKVREVIDVGNGLTPEEIIGSATYNQVHSYCVFYSWPDDDADCVTLSKFNKLDTELRDLRKAGADSKYLQEEELALKEIEALYDNEPLAYAIDLSRFFGTVPFYEHFLNIPRNVLVLVLTMAMGFLGSVVAMSWSFVRTDEGLTLRRFLMLPLVGSMSAFIILVLLKAGQLTLTAGNGDNELSPYFLSFVGIVSGLLSENAYGRMADVGSQFFKSEEVDKPRYAVGLRQAMEESGLGVAELAEYLELNPDDVQELINEDRQATQRQQRLIAACVRRNARDLFTDLGPRKTVSLPSEPHAVVPDVVGYSMSEVSGALARAGLQVGTVTEVADSEVAVGLVINQDPLDAVSVPPGSTVDMAVSTGPAESEPV